MDRRAFLGASLAIGFAPPALAQDEGVVRMRDLYNKNLSFSDYAKSMEGSRVSVQGYMAPPLKADSSFFVLTKRPMAVCPFCETEAEWPDDRFWYFNKIEIT
mgnify:FL=1